MIDWDDLRFFLAVERAGTLSAAAKHLKVTQPTVGRRLAAFEARLGAQLFLRAPTRWTLTEVGRSVLVHAAHMQEQALAAESLAAGRDAGLEGQVRITASDWMVRSILGPALGPFVARHPALCVELVADSRHFSLVKREADIAVRPSKFPHHEVFQRELAAIEFGLFASGTYLARHGAPDFERGCPGHVLIGMSDDMGNIVDRDWLPSLVGQARVVIRTNGREPMVTMAAAGIGMACLPRVLGDAEAGLHLLSTPTPTPRRQLWVGVHRSARATPRVRATLAFLVESFAGRRDLSRVVPATSS